MAKKTTNLESSCNVAFDIHSSIFNHRHFLAPELKRFAEKTDQSITKCDLNLESATKLTNQVLEEKHDQVEDFLTGNEIPQLFEAANKLESHCKEILALEQAGKLRRQKKFEIFEKTVEENKAKLDLTLQSHLRNLDTFYDAKQKDLRKHYEDLESKWK